MRPGLRSRAPASCSCHGETWGSWREEPSRGCCPCHPLVAAQSPSTAPTASLRPLFRPAPPLGPANLRPCPLLVRIPRLSTHTSLLTGRVAVCVGQLLQWSVPVHAGLSSTGAPQLSRSDLPAGLHSAAQGAPGFAAVGSNSTQVSSMHRDVGTTSTSSCNCLRRTPGPPKKKSSIGIPPQPTGRDPRARQCRPPHLVSPSTQVVDCTVYKIQQLAQRLALHSLETASGRNVRA